MNAGPTAFTRTPSLECASAADFVSPVTACFAATYAGDASMATDPKIEDMFMMAPPPDALMAGTP